MSLSCCGSAVCIRTDVSLRVRAKMNWHPLCLHTAFFSFLLLTPAQFELTDGASLVKDASCIKVFFLTVEMVINRGREG